MLKIGLTGGIGCGKSTVCRLFAELGVTIIDADIIGKQLVEPGMPVLDLLKTEFGDQILDAEGALNRALLRDMVFSDAKKKQQLEAIMHPPIYQQIAVDINNSAGAYCIIAIPLLLETQKADIVDRVLVVDCSLEMQLERVMQRDNLSRTQALSIIESQISRQQRLMLADDIINNSATLTELAEQIKRLHNSFILLATARTSSA